MKNKRSINNWVLLTFCIIFFSACEENNKSSSKLPAQNVTSLKAKSVGFIDERGNFKFTDSVLFKKNIEHILKSEHSEVNLSNFKILKDSTDDSTKEPYFKAIAEEKILGIKVVRWLKHQDGKFFYYEESDQKEYLKDSFALGHLIICQGCFQIPCEPVLFKTENSYHWGCDNATCLDCKKSQTIL